MPQTKDKLSLTKSTKIGSATATHSNWLQQAQPDNPEKFIKRNSKYASMYDQFLKNHHDLQAIVNTSKQQQEQHAIKSFISKSLSHKTKRESFEQKFSQQLKPTNSKPIMKMINAMNTITQTIGQRQEVKKQKENKLFFSQNKKVLQLQEDCLLLEYYYKDRSEFVPKNSHNLKAPVQSLNISYLRMRNTSEIRHKRMEQSPRQRQKMFLTHDEGQFEKRKTINYVKEDKFKNDSYRRAQQNHQFKREKNFTQMAQITNQNRANLLTQNQSTTSPEQTHQKQVKFSKVIKLFIKFAYIEQAKQAYFDYIDAEGMDRLAKFVVDNEFSWKLTHTVINQMFEMIVEFKDQKRLEFFDFVQLLDTVQEVAGVDLLELVGQKYPEFFAKDEQTYLIANWPSINKELTSKKVKFTLKLIFSSATNLLLLGQFLPVKQVPRLLSNLGISGNDIPRIRLFETMYWNLRRPEGLNFQEFYFAILMLGVKHNSHQNIFKLITKLKIGQILA